MTAVVGRQLVDAGDEELPLPVVLVVLPIRRLAVVVQSGGLAGRRTDYGDRHVETFGERVDRGRTRRPDQVPRRRQRVHRRPGQSAAAGDCPVGPAAVPQPLLDQPLQRVDGLPGRLSTLGPILREIRPAIRRARRHGHQPNPHLEGERQGKRRRNSHVDGPKTSSVRW